VFCFGFGIAAWLPAVFRQNFGSAVAQQGFGYGYGFCWVVGIEEEITSMTVCGSYLSFRSRSASHLVTPIDRSADSGRKAVSALLSVGNSGTSLLSETSLVN